MVELRVMAMTLRIFKIGALLPVIVQYTGDYLWRLEITSELGIQLMHLKYYHDDKELYPMKISVYTAPSMDDRIQATR